MSEKCNIHSSFNVAARQYCENGCFIADIFFRYFIIRGSFTPNWKEIIVKKKENNYKGQWVSL